MKFFACITILTAAYIFGMRFLVKELAQNKTAEKMRENQSIPLIISATTLYAVVIYQMVNLSLKGVIHLM